MGDWAYQFLSRNTFYNIAPYFPIIISAFCQYVHNTFL